MGVLGLGVSFQSDQRQQQGKFVFNRNLMGTDWNGCLRIRGKFSVRSATTTRKICF